VSRVHFVKHCVALSRHCRRSWSVWLCTFASRKPHQSTQIAEICMRVRPQPVRVCDRHRRWGRRREWQGGHCSVPRTPHERPGHRAPTAQKAVVRRWGRLQWRMTADVSGGSNIVAGDDPNLPQYMSTMRGGTQHQHECAMPFPVAPTSL